MFKVIICDDEIKACENLKSSIDWKSLDFEVDAIFKNGEEAYTYMLQNHVDVVLTDIKMPKLDGVKLSEIVYKKFPKTKVIIFSAYRDFEHAKAAIHYHVFDYILKPINYDEFYITLENLKETLITQTIHNQFQTLSILTQRTEYLSEAFLTHSNLEKLSVALKKTNMMVDLTKSLCAHIIINLKNFDSVIMTNWQYDKATLNNIFVNIIPTQSHNIYYTLLTLHENELEIFAVSRQIIDMESFKSELTTFCNRVSDRINDFFTIDTGYSIKQLCESIHDIDPTKSSIFHPNDASNKPEIISKIIDYLQNNYKEDITLDNLSEKLYIAPCKISTLFKKHTGQNYIDYLTNIRLEKAKELLKDTDIKTSVIGENIGYSSEKYFYKIFKNFVGISPSEYRKIYKQGEQ